MSVPGSKLKPMVLPQGSQRALEALTPATGGRQMQSIIKGAHALGAKPIANPFRSAPPDGSRWANVSGDVTGGAAGKGWVALALQRRRAYTTTTAAPSMATAPALLRKPAAVPQAGVPASMRVESAAVPAVDNIWRTPNQGLEPPGLPASGAIMAGNNTSGKLSTGVSGAGAGAGGAVAGGAVAGGAVAGGAVAGGAVAGLGGSLPMAGSGFKKSRKKRSVAPAELRRILRRVLKGKGVDSDSDGDGDEGGSSSSESDGGRRQMAPKKPSKRMAHAMAGYQLGLAEGQGGGQASAGAGLSVAATGAGMKRKRAPPHPDSNTARRARKVSEIMKGRGLSMGAASRAVKEEGIPY